MSSQNDLVCDFRVVSIYGFNEDSDGLCRTLKSQYYKNNIKNLSEQGDSWWKLCLYWSNRIC